jgi:hypothetical protein
MKRPLVVLILIVLLVVLAVPALAYADGDPAGSPSGQSDPTPVGATPDGWTWDEGASTATD